MCVGCTCAGNPGDGESQCDCPAGTKCHADGSCSVCSKTAGALAGDLEEPHSGCSGGVLRLNPTCNDDGTECLCGPDLICESTTATHCLAMECMCGISSECEEMMPICSMVTNPAMCIGCKGSDGLEGDAMSQGTCPNGQMCLSDGGCKCQLDKEGGGDGDDTTMGTCNPGLLCSVDGTCVECIKDDDCADKGAGYSCSKKGTCELVTFLRLLAN